MGITERREREREEIRRKILDAARELFATEGYDKVTMRGIADAIEYSPTTIYLHFEDKAALMLAVCEGGFVEFGASLERTARAAADPLAGLRATGEAYVAFALDNPMLYDVMFIRPKEWALASPDDPASFQGSVYLFQAAMSAGQLRAGDPREAAALLWAALHGVASLAIVFDDQFDLFDRDAVLARARAATDAVLASLA